MNQPPRKIKDLLKALPDQAGVYIMKDSEEAIIYIGKAASLKKRVPSYFRKKTTDEKAKILSARVRDIEYIITDSEAEALILESTLIKKHRPRYNIDLKDDKRYPYIAVTLSEDYPRVILTRRLIKNGDRYFGPYTDARAARSAVATVNSVFKLKECTKKLPLKSPGRPCLNFNLKRCAGVCRGLISRDDYLSIIDRAVQFLEGDIGPVLSSLNAQMSRYAKGREYEKAAQIRDIIFDIQKISERQNVYTPIGRDQDFIGIINNNNEAVIVLFEFRSGVLLGRKISVYDNAGYYTQGEVLRSFIIDYYNDAKVPPKIVTQYPVKEKELLLVHLKKKGIHKLRISTPAAEIEKNIMNMLKKNMEVIAGDRASRREHELKDSGLMELKNILGMKETPEIIECFDISNIQGKQAVASMVRFKHGVPEKSGYRRYRIKAYETSNDPGMIHEAFGRRVQYLLNEDIPLPDLIVIDGGKPQLGRALEIKKIFEIDIKIISLAKRFEEIFTEGSKEPVRLPRTSPALKIIQNIRDEAHRFAVTYHKKIRAKETNKSAIDSIPGIGPEKKSLLIRHFKNVAKLKDASPDQITAAPGIGRKTAEIIYNYFRNQ